MASESTVLNGKGRVGVYGTIEEPWMVGDHNTRLFHSNLHWAREPFLWKDVLAAKSKLFGLCGSG
ncbi:OLC1v1029694C1 [Oldenlandia corymbosa var. corymbosa]|uniref:OLC1v1029694C1 n=1 Tax=Oldenlandia corymbosa var. corymbosa TaxID=529605 RepID=A0AAV1CF63_OLDCO|nr:OLC1v1029694C1 [Oldenlandia corymbosa var. corymbosa]